MRSLTFLAAALLLAGCEKAETGPVRVSAIGAEPRLANPNLTDIDPPSAFLLDAAAQGLVRFNAAGEIEPALAQRWTVSDDGLYYTMRLADAQWANGEKVTAQQVVSRLRAAIGRASRNELKPLLGAIKEIEAMTDEVLEVSLVAPRPDFLQLLAQPEMAILRDGVGSGPWQAEPAQGGGVRLLPPKREEEGEDVPPTPPILLRGEPAARAVARFALGEAELVVGGTLGDLPLARAAAAPANALAFDPVAGLFGLAFTHAEGPFGTSEARHALAMAIDRSALVATLGVPGLLPRETLIPPQLADLPVAAAPPWAPIPAAERRATAARLLAGLEERPETVRVAMPAGRGYDLVLAHLRRDWAALGLATERVAPGEEADLVLIDEVAPAGFASWYLRRLACGQKRACDPAVDEMLEAARIAPTRANRRALLANADRLLATSGLYVPIAAPVRWSLVAPRLTGFRTNPFGRHSAAELIRPEA